MADLTKIVKEWIGNYSVAGEHERLLREILKAMAAEIKANTESLGHALKTCENLLKTCNTLSERIDLLRKEHKP